MEILVVLVVALIVFGPKRLPELGNSLGKGIRDFSKGIKGEEQESPLAKLDPAAAKAEAGDGVKATQSS